MLCLLTNTSKAFLTFEQINAGDFGAVGERLTFELKSHFRDFGVFGDGLNILSLGRLAEAS